MAAYSGDYKVQARDGKAHFNVANLNNRLEDFVCKEVTGENGRWGTWGRMENQRRTIRREAMVVESKEAGAWRIHPQPWKKLGDISENLKDHSSHILPPHS